MNTLQLRYFQSDQQTKPKKKQQNKDEKLEKKSRAKHESNEAEKTSRRDMTENKIPYFVMRHLNIIWCYRYTYTVHVYICIYARIVKSMHITWKIERKKRTEQRRYGDFIFVEKRVNRENTYKPSKPVYGLGATFITTYVAFFEYICYAFGS